MPDSPPPVDVITIPDSTATKPAKQSASATDAKNVAAARHARKRLGKMLDGAAALKTTGLFRGPLDYNGLVKLCVDFDKADAGVIAAPKKGSKTAETLAVVTREAEATLTVILSLVDVMYPLGTEGRAAFYPGLGGQRTLEVELGAALTGLAQDAAGPKLLPAMPETDVKAGQALLTKLTAATKANAMEETAHDDNKALRAQAGKTIRTLVKRAESLLRTVLKAKPADLLKYGLKPGLRALGVGK